jgi:hypothetical protein
LAESGVLKQFNQGRIKCKISPLLKDAIEPNVDIFLCWGLQYLTCRLDNKEPFKSLDGEKEFGFSLLVDAAARDGQKVFLVRANKKPRIIAKGELILK